MRNFTKTLLCLIVIYEISLASPIYANREGEEKRKILDSKIPIEENNGDNFQIWKSLYNLAEKIYEKIISALKMVIYKTVEKENKSLYERIV